MSEFLARIVSLVSAGEVRISAHGYDEIAADGIFASDLLDGIAAGEAIEEYPDYPKGPCVLVLQTDQGGKPIHALWGIPSGAASPAVLVTAYRPDVGRWSDDFRKRRK